MAELPDNNLCSLKKEFFEAAISFFADLTWKRFKGFLSLTALLIVAVVIFDSYTSYFTLNRLKHSAELISQLQTIESTELHRSQELNVAYKSLCNQVTEAVAIKPWTLRFSAPSIQIPYSRFFKFIAAAAPWMLISIIMLPDVFRKKPNSLGGFFILHILGFISGILGIHFPSFLWPWGNLLIIPLFTPITLLCIAGYVSIKAAQNQKLQQAQKV